MLPPCNLNRHLVLLPFLSPLFRLNVSALIFYRECNLLQKRIPLIFRRHVFFSAANLLIVIVKCHDIV